MLQIIKLTVNGKPCEIAVDRRWSLAEALRQALGLTSVKKGCEVGECGACTVLVDGRAIDSCLYLALWAEGKSVVTVEGLKSGDNDLHPIQKAFIEECAVQCGFCTPASSCPRWRSWARAGYIPGTSCASSSPAISAAAPATRTF